jgi:tRNA (cmo5U34)-methyltransferase
MTAPAFDFEATYGATYDRFIRKVVPGYDAMFQMTLAVLRRAVGDTARVLVVGSGSGNELLEFGTAMPRWTFTGVDTSAQMVAITAERVREAGLSERVTLVHGAVDRVPEAAPFDAASMLLVMHFVEGVPAKRRLLEGIAARLRPGGALALIDYHGTPGTTQHDFLLDAWMEYVMIRGLSREEMLDYRGRIERGVYSISLEATLALLREAGFEEAVPYYRGIPFGGWIARRT